MKIVCESYEYEKDMQDLVNLFYPEGAPFSIHHKDSTLGSTITSTIIINDGLNEKEYVKFFTLPNGLTPLREKSFKKGAFKNHLYQVLSAIAKKTFPWGSLTGIRPCKMMREMV